MTRINPITMRRVENYANCYHAYLSVRDKQLHVYIELVPKTKWRYQIYSMETSSIIHEECGYTTYREAKSALETKLAEMMIH